MAPTTVSATKAMTVSGPSATSLSSSACSGAGGVVAVAFALPLEAIGVAGVDVMGLDQQRLERRPPPGVAARRQRAERVAVVALPARDDAATLRLARLDEILPRHLERGLDGLGPAADQIDAAQARRRVGYEPVGEPLGGLGGEEGGVGVGERVELPAQRRDHRRVAMAEARDRRAAGGVEIAPALGVDDLDAGAEDRDGQVGVCGAMQNMRHSSHPDRAGRRES